MNAAEEPPNQLTKAPKEADKARRKEVVQTLATQLGETAEGPRTQLKKVVNILGPEQALAFLQETLALEAQGGLMLPDGSRRRTPGGVFFYLVRTKGQKLSKPCGRGCQRNPRQKMARPQRTTKKYAPPSQPLPLHSPLQRWSGRIAWQSIKKWEARKEPRP